VVGESGIGKTTFLNSLLRRYIDNFSLPLEPVASATTTDDKKSVDITNLGQFEILTDAGDGLVCTCAYILYYITLYYII
jgi:septin family protein